MFDFETKKQLKTGKPAAFKEVFRLLYPRMRGYCKLFIADDNEVEDVIQECFITLWEKRKSINPEKSIESFIFVILRNRCLNVLKSKKIEDRKVEIENLDVNELQYLYQLDFSEKEEKSIEEMLIESFREAVDELPEKMKQVFVACKIQGKKQKEVAEELGISVKMIEKQISKAKLQIRDKLMKQYPSMVVIILLLLS
ncbi:RNA polymerase sigma-70 factor, ECF subfamily [Tangfeifania diversioriginum]|uniref:RNA polymerase sigma-70 factor, ECF subfamily n=1 Tax=Tangfeifania diversioriginum TaxID=1168035 RepID=A0A1M6MAS9_9BACT|nr:RNA polymerase sigma-70 factor [Tangfeifania diversioriginum]SHJ80480.1 RNA polymerase sigma-70 factor, ECF subfamily [Tangfeifania diversioriginum]